MIHKNMVEKDIDIDFMSDLYDVGTKKALGYLPKKNIPKHGKDTVENVIDWCYKNNKEYKLFTQGACGVSSGALYVWDEEMLRNMLEKYKVDLKEAGIPITPKRYVIHIAKNVVYKDDYPDAYKIIGMTFNDPRFIKYMQI